jgi:hypothetical protein
MKSGRLFVRFSGVCVLFVLMFIFTTGSFSQESCIFQFETLKTKKISGSLVVFPEHEIRVNWGDGSEDIFSQGRHNYTKDYGKPVDATVKISGGSVKALREFAMTERNANIRFELKDIPRGLTRLDIRGRNTVAGELKTLPEGLVSLQLDGRNTISGDIADLPEGLAKCRIFSPGHKITGNVEDLPAGLTSFSCFGSKNRITGDVKDLPEGLEYLMLTGSNTLSGDIENLPRGMRFFRIGGFNTLSGSLSGLPSVMGSFYYAADRLGRKKDAITGDIAELPAGLTIFSYNGNEIVFEYTPGREWAEGMERFELTTKVNSYALDTPAFDSLLQDLSKTTWQGSKVIKVSARRSEASSEAFKTLDEMGVILE